MRAFRLVPFLVLAAVLAGCQSLPMPTPSGSSTASGSQGGSTPTDGTAVDVSQVGGAEASGDLIDPCSLLTVDEIESATGVSVLKVVRGEVHNDGSQLCVYAMDAEGSAASALAGAPGLPDDGSLGSIVNGLEGSGAAIGIWLSAQDPDEDYSGDGSDGEQTPPNIQVEKLALGKGALVIATPNGGAGIAANPQNVLLTVMDLIAGPASTASLKAMLTTAYGRLVG